MKIIGAKGKEMFLNNCEVQKGCATILLYSNCLNFRVIISGKFYNC